ncbi:TRAP transporter TatT component family protein [Spectribacter hydrogenooxidans]
MKIAISLALMLLSLAVHAGDLPADLRELQHAWAHANYQIEDEARKEAAFEELEKQAAALKAAYPGRAEALIWEGIVLSSYAGVKGGLGALGLVKRARADYERAIDIDGRALVGSAHTSLGVLYYKVPGWPLSFGDDDKAENHLKQALAINPGGIDPNYFYAEFLIEEREEYQTAKPYLEKALAASDRSERPVADAGRRAEARALQHRLWANLNE